MSSVLEGEREPLLVNPAEHSCTDLNGTHSGYRGLHTKPQHTNLESKTNLHSFSDLESRLSPLLFDCLPESGFHQLHCRCRVSLRQ